MYVVIQVCSRGSKKGPQISQVSDVMSKDKAYAEALNWATEQSGEDEGTICQELEQDGDYLDPDGEYSIAVVNLGEISSTQ